MIIATKDLVSNTVVDENLNHAKDPSAELQLRSDSKLVIKPITTKSSQSLLQRYLQQTKLEELIEQKSTMMTPRQIKQLQACSQRVAAILQEYIAAKP